MRRLSSPSSRVTSTNGGVVVVLVVVEISSIRIKSNVITDHEKTTYFRMKSTRASIAISVASRSNLGWAQVSQLRHFCWYSRSILIVPRPRGVSQNVNNVDDFVEVQAGFFVLPLGLKFG